MWDLDDLCNVFLVYYYCYCCCQVLRMLLFVREGGREGKKKKASFDRGYFAEVKWMQELEVGLEPTIY